MRKKHLKWETIGLSVLMAFSFSACSGAPSKSAATSKAANSQKASSQSPSAAWLQQAKLDQAESTDDLYTQAKKDGKIVIYTTTGKVNSLKKSFVKKYPGIDIRVYDLKADSLINKVVTEQHSNIHNADVIVTNDDGGSVLHTLKEDGIVHKYIPQNISKHIVAPFNEAPGYVPYVEFRTLVYNTKTFKTCPITNWWQLTLPKWKGKVMIADPMHSPNQMDQFTAMTVHADEMAKAYKEQFGKDIVLHGTKNAGYEFIKELMANGVVLESDGDDIQTAVVHSTASDPRIGLLISGDLSKFGKKPLSIAWDMKPRLSQADVVYSFIADQAKDVAGAKLFMLWMMGGKDGKGAGLKTFKIPGAYVPRDDVKTPSSVPLSKLSIWPYDSDKFFAASPEVKKFWLSLQK